MVSIVIRLFDTKALQRGDYNILKLNIIKFWKQDFKFHDSQYVLYGNSFNLWLQSVQIMSNAQIKM